MRSSLCLIKRQSRAADSNRPIAVVSSNRCGYHLGMAEKLVAFGEITFDAQRGTLSKSGKPLNVSERATSLLAALIDADGQVASKQDLMAKAWPSMVVEEGNLTVQIAALRKALGSDAAGNDWIVTVPRVGYRLLLPQVAAVATSEHIVLPSLAVLPFANLSGDTEQDYFADGVVEDVITALSRFKSFAVIARNSSFTYKGQTVDVRQVGRELGVRYILEGSVRRASNGLRISAQLVDTATAAHLWARQFDGSVGDVFAFQDQITESVVAIVEPNIREAEIARSRRERPQSLAAYDLYLKALALRWQVITRTEMEEVNDHLARALELEPENAIYLAAAAWSLQAPNIRGWEPISPDRRKLCQSYIERALRYVGHDATVLSQCSLLLAHAFHEFQRGTELARRAIDSNPNELSAVNVAGINELHFGDIDVAANYFQRAIRLNPRDVSAPWPLTAMAHVEMIKGNFVEALHWAERSWALNPQYYFGYWTLIAANAHLGRLEEARRWLAKFRILAPSATITSILAGEPAKDPSRMASFIEGLRLAGLPEA